MKKMFQKIQANQKGLTLIEILISIVILAMLVGPFLSMFVFSTKTNVSTKKMMDTTYIAQSCMEQLYEMSTNSTTKEFEKTRDELTAQGYSESIVGQEYTYKKEKEGFYVRITIDQAAHSGFMNKVVVAVFHDSGYSNLSTKMENILSWE